jgi:hypothetical protein
MKSLHFFENHPFIDGHRSWQKFIHNSLQNLNLTTCSLITFAVSNACAVEIKIKWFIRKHMTYAYENTYPYASPILQLSYSFSLMFQDIYLSFISFNIHVV